MIHDTKINGQMIHDAPNSKLALLTLKISKRKIYYSIKSYAFVIECWKMISLKLTVFWFVYHWRTSSSGNKCFESILFELKLLNKSCNLICQSQNISRTKNRKDAFKAESIGYWIMFFNVSTWKQRNYNFTMNILTFHQFFLLISVILRCTPFS